MHGYQRVVLLVLLLALFWMGGVLMFLSNSSSNQQLIEDAHFNKLYKPGGKQIAPEEQTNHFVPPFHMDGIATKDSKNEQEKENVEPITTKNDKENFFTNLVKANENDNAFANQADVTKDNTIASKPKPAHSQYATNPTISKMESIFPSSDSTFESMLTPQSGYMSDPAIVILTHNRKKYLKPCIEELAKQEELKSFKLYISNDSPSDWPHVSRELNDATLPSYTPIVHSTYMKVNNGMSNTISLARAQKGLPARDPFLGNSYYKIARHYFLALDAVFSIQNHSHAIMLEEDLLVAPDFLAYFSQAAAVLNEDKTVWCVSAWNDNGKKGIVFDMKRLFRSNYFPGLGWMLSKELWTELREIWPVTATTGWDHWMRLDNIAKGRECIIPEVSRVRHVSVDGTNVKSGDTKKFDQLLISNRDAKAGFGDLSYLVHNNYEMLMQKMVDNALRSSASTISQDMKKTNNQAVLLLSPEGRWNKQGIMFGLWSNGMGFRGAHNGLIMSYIDKHPVILANQKKTFYLKSDERIFRHNDLTIIGAQRTENCASACRRIKKTCDGEQFFFLNTCEALLSVFPCEGGCGYQIGRELPCFVVDHETAFGQCLISDEPANECASSHPTTKRLCPCV